MKQTNNAIKFLMAQYRAIFKNANIAMLAAIAASALAAGQAQAADIANWKDVATGDYNGGQEASDKTLKVVVSDDEANNKSSGNFDVNITAGADHTIKGSTHGHALSGGATANTSITLAGDKSKPAQTKLEIGGATDAYVGVTVKSFNNYGGTLSVVGGTDASSLTATNIVIGGSAPAAGDAPATVADADPYAIVSLGAKGQIIGAESGSFLVKTGGELQFAGADSVADAKSGLTIDGGAVSVSGAATGTIKGALTMNSGKLTVSGGATATSLKVTGSTTINDGTIKVASGTAGGSLTFEKGVTLNSGSLTIEDGTDAATSGKLVVSGDAVFNEGSTFTLGGSGAATFNGNVKFAAGTLASTGTIDLGTVGGATSDAVRNAKLEVAAADFDKLFKDDAKVKVAGHAASGGELTIAVTGEEKIDLVKSGLFASATGKIDLTGGLEVEATNKAKVAVNVTGNKADFSADLIDDSEIGKVGLSFGELAVGNTETAFTLKGANNEVTVSKSLSHAKGAAQDIKVVSGGTLNLFADASGSVTAKSITLDAASGPGGKLNVKGKWELPSLTVTSGSANLTNATVTLKQDAVLTTTQTNGVLTLNSSSLDATKGKLQLGESAAKLEAGSKFTATGGQLYTISGTGDSAIVTPTNAADGNKAPKNAFTSTDGSGILEIKDAASGTVDAALANKIKEALGYTGFVEFGGNTKIEAYDQPTANFSNTDMSVVGMYDNTQAVMDQNNTINKGVAAGSIKLHSGTGVGVVSKGVILSNADKTGNGMFVQTSAGQPGSVQLSGTSSSITLNGNGKIGAVDAAAAGNGSIMIGSQAKNVASNVEVVGAIGGTNEVGKLVVDGKASLRINAQAGQGSIKAQNLTLADGSKLFAVGQDITVSTAAKLDGDVTAKSMTLNGTGVHSVAGDALVDLEKLSVAGTLAVGNDDPTISGSATLIADQMNVTGTLFVDPDWKQPHATVIVNNLDGSTGETHAGTLNGSAIVGKNAVLAVGFDKSETAKVDSLIGQYLNANESFSSGSGANDVGNALILNKSITVADNKAIIVDKTASIDLANGTTTPDIATNQNSVVLGANSALVVTDKAFAKDSNGAKVGPAITLSNNTSNKFVGNGGKVILSGNFTAADNALKIVSGTGLTVSGTTEVTTLNGLLAGKLTSAGGTVDLNTTDKVKESFLDVATPVRNLLVDSLEGKYATNTGAGVDFVLAAASNTVTGYDVDAAAHAATYAGAQQAAVAAVTTMADAMFGRVGAVGVEAASISATGSQANGGVWLTPMYKSVDSDGFNAEGASYGSDVDLAGVAFGTDTVNGNMRFGAVFNIGSGDAEGKGNGNGLKDEFDYYGFGIYSAMGFGNFALVGDASMTVISHEVEGLGLRGKADTTAVTMGVTGQYTVATPAVDVTPHLGARFIRLNTDSYDLVGADGAIATTDFDVQNVFSVPLGVTLSKGFTTGGWTLAPSADLTVAFNTGDTEAKSTTTFEGLPSIGLNTEVLDKVQYGVTLGLGAQYGAFGTSFGINYTGSSNTDSFGVNALARYMF